MRSIGLSAVVCGLALLLVTGCKAERDPADALFSVQLRPASGTELGAVTLESGEDYEVLIVAEGIRSGDHGWRAKVTGHLERGGAHQRFAGSPKRYIDRRTDGNGRVYWSQLLIAQFTAESDGAWKVWLDEVEFVAPSQGTVMLQIHRERGALERINWAVLGIVGSVFGVLGLIIYAVVRSSREGGGSGGSSSSYFWSGSSCGSSCGGGGGCGGGCGGCGGCG